MRCDRAWALPPKRGGGKHRSAFAIVDSSEVFFVPPKFWAWARVISLQGGNHTFHVESQWGRKKITSAGFGKGWCEEIGPQSVHSKLHVDGWMPDICMHAFNHWKHVTWCVSRRALLHMEGWKAYRAQAMIWLRILIDTGR